ncbi:MAG TPA: hypothetical protein VG293_08945 [Solirubrobacteraceae bacterium]|nr:hypothetical protein [Solirubrobacteraceae bacterium]
MATESNLESPQGVRTYRGRTLEEILPQIREELGPDAIILREREGLVGGVGGFFAQRFTEVEARPGDETPVSRGSGGGIDIYDEEEDDELGFEHGPQEAASERSLLPSGEPIGTEEQMDISARRQTPAEQPQRPEPKPFVPPELQRERIIPRDPQGEPSAPTRRFETDVFLERLREASQVLPEDAEELDGPPAAAPSSAAPSAAAPSAPAPVDEPESAEHSPSEPEDAEPEIKPRRPARRAPPERKPRTPQQRRPRPATRPTPSGKPKSQAEQAEQAKEQVPPQPQPVPVDPWTAAMAALVADTEPEGAAPPRTPASPSAVPPSAGPARSAYDEVRPRPGSLRTGLPTDSPAARPSAPTPPRPVPPRAAAPSPSTPPVAPLELRAGREGALRGLISRLFGGRFASTTLPKPSPPRPIDQAAASAIAGELTTRGASQSWSGQLVGTAAAHGTALSGSLLAAAEAELARRIVPAPALPATGAAVAFIGAGGTGKTRCTAALASAYSRASTLGVVVIAVDNPSGARELKRMLEGDGVPVLSLNPERAAQAVAAYREGGFVIIDTPATTPTDPAALDALGATLARLEPDAAFVTLPATVGPQAARRALAGFGRLNPAAIAITHADETDQLAVVVEIAIANRIPLAYFHAGTDHRSAISAIGAAALAQELLAS